MDVKKDEFEVEMNGDSIFGFFCVPMDINIDEFGRRFVNYLCAELAERKQNAAS